MTTPYRVVICPTCESHQMVPPHKADRCSHCTGPIPMTTPTRKMQANPRKAGPLRHHAEEHDWDIDCKVGVPCLPTPAPVPPPTSRDTECNRLAGEIVALQGELATARELLKNCEWCLRHVGAGEASMAMQTANKIRDTLAHGKDNKE